MSICFVLQLVLAVIPDSTVTFHWLASKSQENRRETCSFNKFSQPRSHVPNEVTLNTHAQIYVGHLAFDLLAKTTVNRREKNMSTFEIV